MLNYVCKQIAINCVQLTFNEIGVKIMYYSVYVYYDVTKHFTFYDLKSVILFCKDISVDYNVYVADFNNNELDVTTNILSKVVKSYVS